MKTGNNAGIDWALLEQYQQMLGTAGLAESVQMFFTMGPEYFAELTALHQARDEANFRKQAHKLKGSCRSLGFQRLGNAMQRFEKDDWQWQDIGAEIEQWPHHFAADTAIVQEWLLKISG